MEVRFSKTKNPTNACMSVIRSIWLIKVEPFYRWNAIKASVSDIIAVRSRKGRGIITLTKKQHVINENELMFFMNENLLTYQSSADGWEFAWYIFRTDNMQSIPFDTIFKLSEVPYENVLTDECIGLLNINTVESCSLASSVFSQLLNRWLFSIGELKKPAQYKNEINKVIYMINSDFKSGLKVDDLAKSINLSTRRFHDIFKASTGLTPKEYIDEVKMTRADELLLKTNMSVREISEYLGYANQFHFCNVFRKHRRVSPSCFRSMVYNT